MLIIRQTFLEKHTEIREIRIMHIDATHSTFYNVVKVDCGNICMNVLVTHARR